MVDVMRGGNLGSALSPLLYLLFVADLPPLPSNIHIFQYADDTVFLALSSTIQHINRTMNEAINTFTSLCVSGDSP